MQPDQKNQNENENGDEKSNFVFLAEGKVWTNEIYLDWGQEFPESPFPPDVAQDVAA